MLYPLSYGGIIVKCPAVVDLMQGVLAVGTKLGTKS